MEPQLIIKYRRRPSFLDSSLRLDGITEILTLLTNNPMYFRQIRRVTRIRYAPAILKYLKFCKEKGLVQWNEELLIIQNGRGTSKKAHYYTVYTVSDKGRVFLEMFS
jgi:predicted transcriptional regulator